MNIDSEQIQSIGEIAILILSFFFGHKTGTYKKRKKQA